MDKETYIGLAAVRMERAEELLDEAEELLGKGRYKSANNRAYYSIEKAMKALLAMKEITADTHNGCLSQFNIHYIKSGEGDFKRGDYKKLASVERIRNSSDYDDFYIADKSECEEVVRTARQFFEKADQYIKNANGS
jgi:uncharacterized protein (UPF0332 family)